MEAIKAAGGHDKWLKSIEGATPDPLEIGSYVLKVARPPQQEVKLHLKYTGPYKAMMEKKEDLLESTVIHHRPIFLIFE